MTGNQPMAMFRENKNNLSTISSTSTNDSQNNNMELIYENVPQRHLIKTQGRVPNSKAGNILLPPGQVIPANNNTVANGDAKRLTQSIAAIAAQRKATQHHKDLMQELGHGKNDSSSTSNSPNRLYNPNLKSSNENGLDASGAKANKKKVKIKEIVQYKLPDDGYPSANELDDYELVITHLYYIYLKF